MIIDYSNKLNNTGKHNNNLSLLYFYIEGVTLIQEKCPINRENTFHFLLYFKF